MLAQPDAELVDQGLAALLTHAAPLGRSCAIDLALDREQRIGAGDSLDSDRRLVEPRQVKEVAPRMRPAGDLDDRPGLAARLVQPVEAAVGVSLCHSQSNFVACAKVFRGEEVARRRAV